MADLDKATQTFITNLEAKTGKTVAQWVKIARKGGARHGEIVKYLKAEHGMGHGHANYIALQALADATPAGAADAVAAQYSGAKAGLRPIYDAVASAVRKLGKDVEFAPKKNYVSLRRSKQFGCIVPATNSRIDVGLILKSARAAGRLEKSTDSMFTHRVKVTSVREVDKELVALLKQAYEAA